MSPRTCIIWAENIEIFGNIEDAFKLTFFNKCEENDQKVINEHYQRCFGKELIENSHQKQKGSKDINSVYDATARALSDNKISSVNESGITIKDSSSNNIIIFNSENKDIDYHSREIVDFASLSLRFTNNEVFNKYLPQDKYEIEVFKIINAARSIAIGTRKFIGCKLNLDKIIQNSDVLFNKENDKSFLETHSLIFKYFFKKFSNEKNKYSKSFTKSFPNLPLSLLNELNNQIYDQKKFFESVLKFIKFFYSKDKDEKKKKKNLKMIQTFKKILINWKKKK